MVRSKARRAAVPSLAAPPLCRHAISSVASEDEEVHPAPRNSFLPCSIHYPCPATAVAMIARPSAMPSIIARSMPSEREGKPSKSPPARRSEGRQRDRTGSHFPAPCFSPTAPTTFGCRHPPRKAEPRRGGLALRRFISKEPPQRKEAERRRVERGGRPIVTQDQRTAPEPELMELSQGRLHDLRSVVAGDADGEHLGTRHDSARGSSTSQTTAGMDDTQLISHRPAEACLMSPPITRT
jgi:hypothetical protein